MASSAGGKEADELAQVTPVPWGDHTCLPAVTQGSWGSLAVAGVEPSGARHLGSSRHGSGGSSLGPGLSHGCALACPLGGCDQD